MKNFIKKRKKLLIFLVIVILLGLWIFSSISKQLSMLPTVETTKLELTELVNSVNVDGVVESENSKKIFTQLALPVENNHVEVGDTVKEGDVLCELDTRTLEEQIKQQSATASSASAINNNSIKLAEKQIDMAVNDVEGSKNAAIIQAEQAIVSAELALNQAEVAYDNSVDTLQEYRKQRRDSEVDRDLADATLTQYESSRNSAFAAYETAKEGVRLAKESLQITINSVENQLTGYQDSITTNKVAATSTNSQWIAIESLKGDLDRAVVTSPIDGVVTAVYVTEGTPTAGLMYVVEDLKTLKVTAKLKEYDLSFVDIGNAVTIKSDATREELFTGKVEKISPTTSKTATGDNIVGTGEFVTEISVEAESDAVLKIGTKARVDIVYEKKDQALNVSSASIAVNEAGKDIVYILVHEAENIYVVTEVPVEIGMEGDFNVEISSPDLKEGDAIVKTAKDVTPGMRVQIPVVEEAEAGKTDANDTQAAMISVRG